MKKSGILALVIVMIAALCSCAGAEVPGVLADFTEQASELTNPDTRNYAYCYYDWDEDGEDEAVIDYFGSGEIRITADGEGIALDLMGSMTLKMAP